MATPNWTLNRPAKVVELVKAAARRHYVTPKEILGGSRRKQTVIARREVIVALRKCGHSLPEIGRYLGGIDHTSVLHHLKVAELELLRTLAAVSTWTPDQADLSGEWAI